ncbi:2-polyprenyl-3-methyl-6-methoxy-1,4-benzoquinone monooxygenase [endosymbiont of unidentified scaly snail isolate Monju]|uniref:2-polyprenyl-3-methyl-6-methoxy-1,4-benzoquinone monooxygenase n=1 Tax=endosymbiont of unidentified scaly snail isolate Monju TaxID=1248727 RepID=UPI0003891E46|nr:2-polyprenyl-3-methyl-6-methoxy-1,4-benzoquinone monooxygenase [endosymbiont of unidentified scaly snail isolate Monju]BAN70188.1 ubiquinone biosynthesis monooxygenase Coq7 [endosymbiont of unidentified scaly snail isolate Monju]
MSNRHYSTADTLLLGFDQALRTLFGQPKVTGRPNPADSIEETELDERQRDHIARLLRIDHTGEVCAQGLSQGQALTARDPEVRDAMEQSADEENDHLAWCQQRIEELGGRTSLLNPLWYAGSLAIGATAGLAGDRWSLGFVGETERQVEAHLRSHLDEIPPEDRRSRAILEQMKTDEIEHGEKAMRHGGAELPAPVKLAMKLTSKVMTKSVYYL